MERREGAAGEGERASKAKARRPNTRPRARPIYVWTTPAERAEIEARARSTGLSLSAYLRSVGRGYQPSSTFDSEAVLELARVNADLGRLGGLFKMWLATRPGEGASVVDVEQLLSEVRAVQAQLAEAAGVVRAPGRRRR